MVVEVEDMEVVATVETAEVVAATVAGGVVDMVEVATVETAEVVVDMGVVAMEVRYCYYNNYNKTYIVRLHRFLKWLVDVDLFQVVAVDMVEEATEAAANLPITACDSNLKHFSTFILF